MKYYWGENMNMELGEFIRQLASKAPVPGGGGASALIGATGVALCSMVANLTSGKKKYAQYQEDIDKIQKSRHPHNQCWSSENN